MDKILSQEEISALFSAMSSEERSPDKRSEQVPAAPKIAKYDYRRVDIIPQDQVSCCNYDDQRHARSQRTGSSGAERLYKLIRTISVPVGGEILNSRLTLDDLLRVAEGDIIELAERIGNPIYLCVGDVAMFKGRIIQRGGKKAFEISERCVDSPSHT